ncbi:hypothetical protein Scep_001801 [Stephania cephalantha]|uniref:Uncharacterized protein n=1 Tax=Stephania cephalantha TaxID=152367 RepID=A0AAP0L9S1_9MAGN
MVSIQQEPLSPQKRKPIAIDHKVIKVENSSNKRKWADRDDSRGSFCSDDHRDKKASDPLEWEKCLDINFGQRNLYNKRACEDPRQQRGTTPGLFSSTLGPMSLELELNLPCQSLRSTRSDDISMNLYNSEHSFSLNSNTSAATTNTNTTSISNTSKNMNREMKNSCSIKRCSSWLSFEEDQEEMIAAVCMRCHMLVILCKASPSCPNCKFMHPPQQKSSVNCKPLLPCKE